MSSYSEYKEIIRNNLHYKDFYSKVFHIFEGKGGSQVLTGDILPRNRRIRDLLILNNEMNQALNYVNTEVYNLNKNEIKPASYLFYFSQYGGSKTQFLHLIQYEINRENPNAIIIMFEDLTQINAQNIFSRMLSQIFRKINYIPEFEEDPSKYRQFFDGLNQLVANIQIELNQSKNLKKAEEILSELNKTKNIETQHKLDDLNELLHSSILVDSIGILNHIQKLMQYCSQYGLVFLFLFDEVDLWIDDRSPELKFSRDLINRIKFMKSLLEISDHNIHIFYLFACTDRVNFLLNRDQGPFDAQSPTGSRLLRIYNGAEKILEPGSYGDALSKALIKLTAYYTLANDQKEVDSKFFERILPLLEKKYSSFSRRNCNSKILQIIRFYFILYNDLSSGLNQWHRDTTRYGRLIEDHLDRILKRINIKFVREQVPIDPNFYNKNKIDGYFVNYDLDGNEIKTFVEIKTTNEFKREKSYQVLQWIQMHPDKPIVLLIFSETSLDSIKKEIISFAEKEGFDIKSIDKIHYIHINNAYAFCAIAGIDLVNNDPAEYDKFINAYASWLDFFGNFTSQYQNMKEILGINSFIPLKPSESAELEQSADSLISTEKNTSEPPQNAFSSTTKTCISLLNHLYKEKAFNKTGRMNKSKIESIVQKKSLGISDLENILEYMKKADIILNITNKMVNFIPSFYEMLSIDVFNKKIIQMFADHES